MTLCIAGSHIPCAAYKNREDNLSRQWEDEQAEGLLSKYGQRLKFLAPRSNITVGWSSVWIETTLEAPAVEIGLAVARLMRDGNEHRSDRPSDWHLKMIRRETNDDGKRVVAILISNLTATPDGYDEKNTNKISELVGA